MYSLISTIQSISLVAELAASSTTRHQYGLCVEVTLGLAEDYKIPSLIWPPPNCINIVSAQSDIGALVIGGNRYE